MEKKEVVEIVGLASSVVALIRLIVGLFGGKSEIKKPHQQKEPEMS